MRPPPELKKIFDKDTGAFYFDPTDMTRLLILANDWKRTSQNRLL